MNWVSLILQLFTLRRSLAESHSMVESAKQFAERGKRTVTAMLITAVAALFFFASLLVAVLEIGFQIDRGEGIYYSGLMVSATILFAICAALLLAAYLVGRGVPAPTLPPPESMNPRTERIKDLLEEFLASFLRSLTKPGEKSEKK